MAASRYQVRARRKSCSQPRPSLEGAGEAQRGVARARTILVDAPALQIEGSPVQRESPSRRGSASPTRGHQIAQTPAALAVTMIGAEGEVQVGALVAGGVRLVERLAIGQTVPVRPLAQIALVDDAETAVGADIAPAAACRRSISAAR